MEPTTPYAPEIMEAMETMVAEAATLDTATRRTIVERLGRYTRLAGERLFIPGTKTKVPAEAVLETIERIKAIA